MRMRPTLVAFTIAAGLIMIFTVNGGIATSSASRVSGSSNTPLGRTGTAHSSFTKNEGQWDDRVLYRTTSRGATVWLCRDGITYQFTHRVPSNSDAIEPQPEKDSIQIVVVNASFVDANPNVQVVAENQLESRCNYFLGSDPTKWRTNVPNYSSVTYRNIQPGVDLRYEGQADSLVSSVATQSAVSAGQLTFHYDGNVPVTDLGEGRFTVQTPWGQLSLSAISGATETGLNRDAAPSAMPGADLSLVYSTYLGGSSTEWETGVAVDEISNAYIVGYTYSPDFPTINPLDGSANGDYDVTVTKLSPEGTAMYATYIGGSGADFGYSIKVDETGVAYLTGGTSSSNFPTTTGAFDRTFNLSSDAFVVKLAAGGNALALGTYIGGTSADGGAAIALGLDGSIFVAGSTTSTNFPVPNGFDNSFNDLEGSGGSNDGFVVKLTASGSVLDYGTYLGGQNTDLGKAIDVDITGYAYIAGYTNSSNFPTKNAADPDKNSVWSDGFVTKLGPDGDTLVYSTFLGGTGPDDCRAIAVDAQGYAFVTGTASGPDFPTVFPYQALSGGGDDAFVTRLSKGGNLYVYSTYLGGTSADRGYGIALDLDGGVYVCGGTGSADFPTNRAFDGSYNNTGDAFVVKLGPEMNSLLYGTYLGGAGSDDCRAIAIDLDRKPVVVGITNSSDLPTTPGAWDDAYSGGTYEGFVTRFFDNEPGCGDLGFRPAPDGWSFVNDSATIWPQSWWQQYDYSAPEYPPTWRFTCKSSDFPSWPLFVQAFGESQCYLDPPPGRIIHDPYAEEFWFAVKGKFIGACAGFAVSSLMMFDDQLAVSTEFPGVASVYDIGISDQSSKARTMIASFWTYCYGQHQNDFSINNLSTTPSAALDSCIDMFTRGTRDDQYLSLRNNHGDGAHAVVPYRCQVDWSHPETTRVYVYDNNFPDAEGLYFAINTVTNTWNYSTFPDWGGAKWLHLMDRMSEYASPPLLAATDFALGKSRIDDGNKSVPTSISRLSVFFPANDSAVLAIEMGELGRIGDSSFQTTSEGMPIIPPTGSESPPVGYRLSNLPWTISLTGKTDSVERVSFFIDSTAIVYRRELTDSVCNERLRYLGDSRSLWVSNPDSTSRPYDLKVISNGPDSAVVVEVRQIALSPGDSTFFSITTDMGMLIKNYGAATSYELEVQIASAERDTTFRHSGISIDSNSAHIIVPDWRTQGDSIQILIDSGLTGTFSDTVGVPNQALCACDCHGNPVCDAAICDVLDVVSAVAVAFRNGAAVPDPNAACPFETTDVDCSTFTDVIDVVKIVAVAFRNGNPATEFCVPCP